MFLHNKRLQYTVRVAEPNPGLANLLLEQFGGAQGELAAASRYFTQALAEDDPGRKDLLMDIATEELSHLEVVGSIIVMLNKGAKGRMAEGVEEEGELYRALNGAGNDSHITSLLYGAGSPLTNSAGVPWTAAYIDTIGEPTADMRSNIAAEARAKIVYERLMNVTDDPGVKEALGFLMTREIAHQLSFEKALHAIQPNFPKASCRACLSSPRCTSTCRRARECSRALEPGRRMDVRGKPATRGGWRRRHGHGATGRRRGSATECDEDPHALGPRQRPHYRG